MGSWFGGGNKQAVIAASTANQGVQQQAANNREAAIAGSELSMINQITPNGNLTYSQTGTSANGNPIYTATQSLDPVSQQALDASKQLDLKTNNLAVSQANRATDLMGSNVDLSSDAIGARAAAMINPRLQKRFGDEEAALRASLVNRGIREGSQGFNDAMLSFNQGKTDAYSSDALNARQQAIQEIVLPRNQVLNEIASLAGTQQINQPSFVNTPQAQVRPADYQMAAGQTIQALQAAQQQKQAAMGGMFGLAGNLIGAGATIYNGKK